MTEMQCIIGCADVVSSDNVARCAAPMLITSAQFACQHLLARLVIGLRRLRGGASPDMDPMTWPEWWQKGGPSASSRNTVCRRYSSQRLLIHSVLRAVFLIAICCGHVTDCMRM